MTRTWPARSIRRTVKRGWIEARRAYIELETRRMQPARPSWDEEMTDMVDVAFLDHPRP